MKAFVKFILILVFIYIVTIGCTLQTNIDKSTVIELNADIKEVHILQSTKLDKEGFNSSVSYTNKETLQTFRNIITSATKQNGIVNMTNPNYKLIVIYEDKSSKEFYLWIRESEIGALMHTEDTHTLYNLSEDMSAKLYNLLR